jgi:S-DNA-T family DNA segregation ATPase FtsK/SpoIIIE
MAGGDGPSYIDRLPPGAGLWNGNRVQVALAPIEPRPTARPQLVDLDPTRSLAIVSPRASAIAARLRDRYNVVELAGSTTDARDLVVAQGARRTIVVGDVDEWQSRWGALAAIRQVANVLIEGCTIADFRALTRSRELPPPVSGSPLPAWLLNEDGSVSRAALPV